MLQHNDKELNIVAKFISEKTNKFLSSSNELIDTILIVSHVTSLAQQCVCLYKTKT